MVGELLQYGGDKAIHRINYFNYSNNNGKYCKLSQTKCRWPM